MIDKECECKETDDGTLICLECGEELMTEKMIKVSELREWCEKSAINSIYKNRPYESGFNQAIESILAKFCEVKE